MNHILMLIMLVLFLLLDAIIPSVVAQYDRPVIGILSQETFSLKSYHEDDKPQNSYIAASYVKFLESSGARVIPIRIGKNAEYYKDIVHHTNGLLFPGGAAYFDYPNGYAEAARHLYDYATDLNLNFRIYYPILGICLGMECMAYCATHGHDIRTSCSDVENVALPLNFTDDRNKSRLFASDLAPPVHDLSTKNLTYNSHHYCLTEAEMRAWDLWDDWYILATNTDGKGRDFISIMEHKIMPYYGLQFHPEKNTFEHKPNLLIPHTKEAVRVTQYFSNFFVDECRKNQQLLTDSMLTDIICHYSPVYSENKTAFEQIYLFS